MLKNTKDHFEIANESSILQEYKSYEKNLFTEKLLYLSDLFNF